MSAVESAREEARALLDRMGISEMPVPVERIVRDLGIILQSEVLGEDLSGMAFVKNGQRVIVVNKAHHPNRRRFTIAHEIAHHILDAEHIANSVHVDKAIFRRDRLSETGSDLREIRANSFAAELLMPEDVLRQFANVDINDELEITRIARVFSVSAAALSYRLIGLMG